METILGLIFKIVAPTDTARRLTNHDDKEAHLCHLPDPSLDLRFRSKVMLVLSLFWTTTCAAQGVVTQAFAQLANSPRVIAAQATKHTAATALFVSPQFSRKVSSAEPLLVVTMVEDKSIRSMPRIKTAHFVENSVRSEPTIDRSSSLTTPNGSQIISAQESVRRYRGADHIRPTNIVDRASATITHGCMAFDATGSQRSEFTWFKQAYLVSWPERFNVNQERTIGRTDRGLSDERLTNVEPLMIVKLGSGSLPISLYLPVLRRYGTSKTVDTP